MKNYMRKIQGAVAVIGLLVAQVPAFAHHSVASEFNPDKTVSVKGTISRVEWINPHVYLYVDVKAADGTVATWAFESLPTGFLHKIGITRALLEGNPGDIITVEANPAKDGTKNLGWILKITYPDGHSYTLKA